MDDVRGRIPTEMRRAVLGSTALNFAFIVRELSIVRDQGEVDCASLSPLGFE
ncbi:MAG: hypothetical protein KDA80_03795 [Planctomycetaceae bacterium]|nr:hypothetical protein [Planctomycetaceae bacterium]